jgi:hypothetical protein
MKKRGRRTTRRKPKRRTVISPLAHLARKVHGLDTRVHGLEAEVKGIPKKFIRKRKRPHRLGTLEEHGGPEYWSTGE